MGKIIDSRVAEDAEVIRIVIYPNVEREKPIVFPDDWEKASDIEKSKWMNEYEPEYEYYDNIVTTYRLKDDGGQNLVTKILKNEFGLSDEKNTINNIQVNLGKDLETKITKDIVTLTGKTLKAIGV